MTPTQFKEAINEELAKQGFENRVDVVSATEGYRTVLELESEPTEAEEDFFYERFAHQPNEVEIRGNLIVI